MSRKAKQKRAEARAEAMRQLVDAHAETIVRQAAGYVSTTGPVIANLTVDAGGVPSVRFLPYVPPAVPPVLNALPERERAQLADAIELAGETNGTPVMASQAHPGEDDGATFVALVIYPSGGEA